jgi:hypothetical protein
MSDLVKADLRPEDPNLPAVLPHDDADPPPLADLPLDDGKAALERLRLEAEAEEAAAAAGSAPDPAPVAPVAPASPAPTPPADPAQIMVPKARLDEALTRARNAEAGILRMEGMIQALQRGTPPAAPAQPPQPAAPTLEQLIQAEETRIEEAATRFDAGEITMVEFKRMERDAAAKIISLREQALFEAVMARVPQQGMADELIENRHLAALRKAHPWVAVIEADEGRLQVLVDLARATLQAEGQPIGDGPAESLRLREKVAALADDFGPRWYPQHQAPAPATPPRAPAPAPIPASRPAAPAASNPLARVASHPPNINEMGSTALASNDPTEEMVAAMSTDEIAALPASVRARLQF